jgi:hypothetical protein
VVVSLKDEFHVEFFDRIIEPADRGDQIADYGRLAVQRADDGVDRQFGVTDVSRARHRVVGEASTQQSQGRRGQKQHA